MARSTFSSLLFFAPALAVTCTSLSILSGDKDGRDGKEVLGKLCVATGVTFDVANHEFRTSLAEDELHEVGCKSAESVSVGNHHFLDCSVVYAVQKGRKASVDARPDVLDDPVGGVPLREVLDLSLEVWSLVFGGDSCVDDLFLLVARVVEGGNATHLRDIVNVVPAHSRRRNGVFDFSFVRPASQCGRRNVKVLLYVMTRNEGRHLCPLSGALRLQRRDAYVGYAW